MNSDTRNLFDRQVEFTELNLIKPQLLSVRCLVRNTGKMSWRRLPALESATTISFGYRLRCCANSFARVDKLVTMREDVVEPGEAGSVECLILLPTPTTHFILEIDAVSVSDGASWFSGMGLIPATVELKAPGLPTAQPRFQSTFSEVRVGNVSKSISLISGIITNSGCDPWNDPKEKRADFFLGLRAYSSLDLETVTWEGRGHLERSFLAGGEESQFSAMIPAEHLADAACLRICMLREEHFWFEDFGPSSYLIDLELLRQAGENAQIPYQAEIAPQQCILAAGFLIQINGTLRNTGLRVWNPEGNSRAQPVVIGIKIFLPDTREVLREGRAALPGHAIQPGQSARFSITLSTLAIPPGRYGILLDLVYEGSFWFFQQGGQAVEMGIELLPFSNSSPRRSSDLAFSKPTSIASTKILFISPTLPLFDRQAGGKRLLALLRMLRKQGITVDFFYESSSDLEDAMRYIRPLEQIGIYPRQNILNHIATLVPNHYDVCILGWYDCAERYLPVLRPALPKAKIIIDTVDIHWVRERRGVESGELDLSEEQLAERKLRESTIYSQADQLWLVTEADRQAVMEIDPALPCQLVPLLYDEPAIKERPLDRSGIIFVGGFKHPPNIAAAKRCVAIVESFRKLSGLGVPLYIVGDSPPESIRELDDGATTFVTGYVDDIEPWWERAKVTIAPLQSGAGMKGKICDAVYAGVPVIASPVAVEGLELEPGTDFFLADSDQEFITALRSVFSPETDLHSMTSSARRKISRQTNVEEVAPTVVAGLVYRPVVIAIVTWNNRAMLERCLSAIINNTDFPDFRIAVVSNGCTDGTRELLVELQSKHPGLIDSWFNEENGFFVKPNNFIFSQYPDRDAVMINNDVEVTNRSWLTFLYHGAYYSSSIGAAGGMTLNAEGKVSEAGAEIDLHGYGHNLGRGADPLSVELQIPRTVGFCSGCFLYLRRDALNRVGDLSEVFDPMYYEDVEWQFRIKREGLKTMYVPQAVAIHREGSSAGTDLEKGMKRFQEINRVKFVQMGYLGK